MNIWQMLEWAAWLISALMFAWMVTDAWRVSQKYDEDTLLSSREGVDDLFGDQGKGV